MEAVVNPRTIRATLPVACGDLPWERQYESFEQLGQDVEFYSPLSERDLQVRDSEGRSVLLRVDRLQVCLAVVVPEGGTSEWRWFMSSDRRRYLVLNYHGEFVARAVVGDTKTVTEATRRWPRSRRKRSGIIALPRQWDEETLLTELEEVESLMPDTWVEGLWDVAVGVWS